jgi:hypothetical protein
MRFGDSQPRKGPISVATQCRTNLKEKALKAMGNHGLAIRLCKVASFGPNPQPFPSLGVPYAEG